MIGLWSNIVGGDINIINPDGLSDLDRAKYEAQQNAHNLGIFDAIVIVATNGDIEPKLEDNKNRMQTVHEVEWEGCIVRLIRDEMDRSGYEQVADTESTTAEILRGEAILFRGFAFFGSSACIVESFRFGPWAERFVTYSKEIESEYLIKQKNILAQVKAEELKPHSDIDF